MRVKLGKCGKYGWVEEERDVLMAMGMGEDEMKCVWNSLRDDEMKCKVRTIW